MLNDRLTSVVSTGKNSNLIEMSSKASDNQKPLRSFQQSVQKSVILTNNESTSMSISLANTDATQLISSPSILSQE